MRWSLKIHGMSERTSLSGSGWEESSRSSEGGSQAWGGKVVGVHAAVI